jgi:hypothetical protein
VQDDEGFAVIWRNAQHARSELLGGWILRLGGRLWKLSHVGWFKLLAPRLPSERGENPRKPAEPYRKGVPVIVFRRRA